MNVKISNVSKIWVKVVDERNKDTITCAIPRLRDGMELQGKGMY